MQTQQQQHEFETSSMHGNELRTHSEIALGKFLEPFALSSLNLTVHQLVGAGFEAPNALRALDEPTCLRCGLKKSDANRLLLAVYLLSAGEHLLKYGSPLVQAGCRSVLGLLAMSDTDLKAAGMTSVGHRRELQRHLREDDQLQAAAELAARAKSKGRQAFGGDDPARLLRLSNRGGGDGQLGLELGRRELPSVFCEEPHDKGVGSVDRLFGSSGAGPSGLQALTGQGLHHVGAIGADPIAAGFTFVHRDGSCGGQIW